MNGQNMPAHVSLGSEGRHLQQEILRETSVSGGLNRKEVVDGLFDAIVRNSGVALDGADPPPAEGPELNYSGFVGAGMQAVEDKTRTIKPRPSGPAMENPGLVQRSGIKPVGQTRTANYSPPAYEDPYAASAGGFSASPNQINAIVKFPALIEFLGSDDDVATKIANKIMCECNSLLVGKIGENSRKLNKYAGECKTDRQNMKQYFIGTDDETDKTWACVVTACGPFRGDEAIYFDKKTMAPHVLRVVSYETPEGEEENRAVDVSANFNVVFDYGEEDKKPEDNPTPEPTSTVEASTEDVPPPVEDDQNNSSDKPADQVDEKGK